MAASFCEAHTVCPPGCPGLLSLNDPTHSHTPTRKVLSVFSFYRLKEVKQLPKATQRVHAGYWNLNSSLSSSEARVPTMHSCCVL